MEKFAMFVMVMVVLFSSNVQAKSLSRDARSYDILNLKSGEPGNKMLREIVGTVVLPVLKYQGVKEVDCLPHTDAHKCKQYRKGSSKDRRCQAELAKARCRAVGNVLHPKGIKVRPIEGGEERKIKSGSHRGVSLFWENSFCTESELDSSTEIYREKDRKRLASSQVSVVPERNLSSRPELVVLIMGVSYSRSGDKIGGGRRVCLAMVNDGGRVVKTTICPVGTRREGSVCVRVKMVEKPLDPCPKGSSRVGRVCVMDTEPCPKGSSRVGKVCIQDIDEDKCPAGTEMVKGVCEPVCKKGETRKDGKCVKDSVLSDLDFSFGIAGGIGYLTFCSERTGNPEQASIEAFLEIGKHIRVLAGIQTASMLMVDESNGEESVGRVPLFMLGLEAFASAKDLGAKGHLTRLSFGLRASALGNAEFRAPAIGAFLEFKLSKSWSVKAFAQKVFFEKLAANDLTAPAQESSSWLTGFQVVFKF